MRKLNREKLISLSYDFLKYIFQDSNIEDKIIRVFLFGSVARNDFDGESDIDIFINTDKKNEKLVQKMAERALSRFYKIEGEKWYLKGIKNKISLKVGFLDEWKLKSSIEKEGIILYSLTPTANLKKYLLFYIEPIISAKKRARIIRKLFGRKEKQYTATGIVHEFGGKILSPRVFLVPSTKMNEIATLLSREKANFKIEEVWMCGSF